MLWARDMAVRNTETLIRPRFNLRASWQTLVAELNGVGQAMSLLEDIHDPATVHKSKACG